MIDAALKDLHTESDEALDRIMSVMASEYCKDSLTDLIDMPFVYFHQLESTIYVATLREEERNWNRIRLNKN